MDDYKSISAVILGVLVFHFAHTGTLKLINCENFNYLQLLHKVQSLLKTILLREEDFEALCLLSSRKVMFCKCLCLIRVYFKFAFSYSYGLLR